MCVFFGLSKDCQASNVGLFPGTRVSAFQSVYSGEKGKSFAESSAGVGAGVSVYMDGKYLTPYFGFKVGSMAGTQMFLDNTSEVSTSFNYYSASAEAGFHLFPIERRKKGFNVYFSGGGVIGYNFVALNKEASLENIPYSDQSFSTGYVAGVGSEWILNSADKNKWNLNAEVLFKNESSTLFNQRYDLSCMVFSLGLGW
ncbi:hypothetical protein EP01_16765 [Bdellovibrio bacteriovorus]|nr:hypothetical protein EP01_16765 [Bdellovibrio bacteriovorus]